MNWCCVYLLHLESDYQMCSIYLISCTFHENLFSYFCGIQEETVTLMLFLKVAEKSKVTFGEVTPV